MIGNAIIKEMSTDRFLDGIQIKTRTINDATGVAFNTATGSANMSRTILMFHAMAEKIIPDTTAHKNPSAIRSMENKTDCQNDKVTVSESRHRPTERGDASKISLCKAMLPACQRAIQNTTVHNLIFFFSLCLVCIVIEIILR